MTITNKIVYYISLIRQLIVLFQVIKIKNLLRTNTIESNFNKKMTSISNFWVSENFVYRLGTMTDLD